MKAYESGSPAYFATPPVNLIYSYRASLLQLIREPPSLETRFKLHREASQRIKDAASALGLRQIPVSPDFAANGMTTVRLCESENHRVHQLRNPFAYQLYYPDGLSASDLLPLLFQKGIVVAGGLLESIKGPSNLFPFKLMEIDR